MTGKWAQAIAEAAEDPPADLEAAIREELADLWSGLDEAISRAFRSGWSMQCNWLTTRIIRLSRLAGVTPWQQIPCTLLLDGTYQGILTDAGFGFERPGPDDLAEIQRWQQGQAA